MLVARAKAKEERNGGAMSCDVMPGSGACALLCHEHKVAMLLLFVSLFNNILTILLKSVENC